MSAHENINQFSKIKISSNKNFCLTFSFVFLLVGVYPLVHQNSLRIWALALSGCFLMIAFTKPQLVRPLNYTWARVGLILGKVMVPLVMGALYFSIFFLTGALLKFTKKDILKLKFDASQKTYWSKKENGYFSEESFKNQF